MLTSTTLRLYHAPKRAPKKDFLAPGIMLYDTATHLLMEGKVPAATIATAATTAILKKVIDDLYGTAKDRAIALWGKTRADVKEISIARALGAITKVKTLWNIDKEVSRYDFYYPSVVEFSTSSKRKIDSIKGFGSIGHFVIQGTAGQGKSIFLRYLCGQELYENTSSGRVPIFVELRRITSDTNLANLICQALQRYKLPHSTNAWEYFAASGKFILLLDAFDEVDPSLASRTLQEIEHLSSLNRETLQIIITSRPDAEIQKSANFRVFKLAPLKQADHAPFLRKICTSREQASSLETVLKASSSDVRGLLTTPLMMTLLVILYKSLQTVPDTVPRFYEELFDVLFYRHDHSKPGFKRKRFTQLDDESVKKLFSGLCFFYRLHGLGVMAASDFNECVEQACSTTSISVDPKSLKDELVKTICLVQEEGFEISFIHKSVAQYYAASFVSDSGDDFAQSFYTMCADTYTWSLELRFLSQIDPFRFAKMYELPLLIRAANSFKISIDQQTETCVKNVTDFLRENISLVTVPRGGAEKGKYDFYGWSNITGGVQEAWKEFSYDFISTVTNPLMDDGILIHRELGAKDEDVPDFIRLKTFDSVAEKYYPAASQQVIDAWKARYRKALKIIETEGKKSNMLAAFLSKPKPTKQN